MFSSKIPKETFSPEKFGQMMLPSQISSTQQLQYGGASGLQISKAKLLLMVFGWI